MIPLFVFLATVLSLSASGYEFGVYNHAQQLPFVLRLDEDPRFAADAYYQSFRHFVSGWWLAVRQVATEQNVEAIFLGSHIASRLAAFAALAQFFRGCAIWHPFMLGIGLLTAALSPWLLGFSSIGEHGLFIDYFTHSELTWPLIVFALLSLQTRRYSVAAACAAGIFLVNAFIGIWMVGIATYLLMASDSRPGWRDLLRPIAVFTLLSLPVTIWIASSLLEPEPYEAFSFRQYVQEWYPRHFLITAATWRSWLEFASYTLAALLAARFIPGGRYWRSFASAVLLFLGLGAIAPLLVDKRLIFDLNLLRLDGLIQFFATLTVVAVGLRWIAIANTAREPTRDVEVDALSGALLLCSVLFVVGPVFAAAVLGGRIAAERLASWKATGGSTPFSLLSGRVDAWLRQPEWLILGFLLLVPTTVFVSPMRLEQALGQIAAGTMFLFWQPGFRRRARYAPLVAAIAAAVALAATTTLPHRDQSVASRIEVQRDWRELVRWTRMHPIRGPVLVPLEDYGWNFQLHARVPVWVDWMRGAAVLWRPGFYTQWHQRFEEVGRLSTPDEFLAYAEKHSISFVVLARDVGGCGGAFRPLHQNRSYVLCGGT